LIELVGVDERQLSTLACNTKAIPTLTVGDCPGVLLVRKLNALLFLLGFCVDLPDHASLEGQEEVFGTID